MAYPLTAPLAGTVTYSNSTLFDGWVLLLLALPTGYTYATVSNQLLPQRLGPRFQVRIQQGVYDQSVKVYQNASLQPPNTQYVAYYYDNEGTVLGNTSLFTVNASPYTITVPSMTAPSATVTPPTP